MDVTIKDAWTNQNLDELMKLLPKIKDQLNSMSRIQWQIEKDVIQAQGFPKHQNMFVTYGYVWETSQWFMYFRYYNYEERTNMKIIVKDMDDLIAVFKGWRVIFESDMPQGVQQQMEL